MLTFYDSQGYPGALFDRVLSCLLLSRPTDHPGGDGPLVCNGSGTSRRHRDVRVEAHFNLSSKRGHVCARRHLTCRSLPPERCGTWAAARTPQPQNPGRVAVCHGCPLHPGFCGCPYAYACGAGASYSATQEVRIRRIGRRPRSDEGLDPMTTSLAAALCALELGHLEPRAEDVSGMCPASTEALEQTTTAIWSDLFATLQNTSLERDIEEMGWPGQPLPPGRGEKARDHRPSHRRDQAPPGRAGRFGDQHRQPRRQDRPCKEDRGSRHLLRTHARHRSGTLYPRDRPFLDPVRPVTAFRSGLRRQSLTDAPSFRFAASWSATPTRHRVRP
jgi:hypothetical protein